MEPKTVLVTGAAGGMGQAVCDRLARQGYTVYGLDLKGDPERKIYAADLRDGASVRAAARQIAEEAVRLDAVVHLAGIFDLDSLVEISEEAFLRILDINLCGVYRVNQAFLPLLRPGSRIVITSSELAPLSPLPFTGIYGLTKTAVEQYAAALRMELQLLGIHVCVLRPGAVSTGMLGVSTGRLERFCAETRLYACNAARFRAITDRVESRSIPPEKLAGKVASILASRRPRLVVCVNRNPLLLLMSALPKRLQLFLIRKILAPS